MVVSVNKLAPSAVVLAFVGYCIWPSVSELASSSPPPSAPKKPPELAASLFAPVLAPPTAKNPWGGKDAEALAASRNPVAAAEQITETPADIAKPEADEPQIDLLAGLTLDATYISGDQRLAVINGATYAAQELLSSSALSGPQIKVASVLPYSVLLECRGQRAELTYLDIGAPLDSSLKGASDDSRGTPAAKRSSSDAKSGRSNRPSKTTK
jgi:hypothetical protein